MKSKLGIFIVLEAFTLFVAQAQTLLTKQWEKAITTTLSSYAYPQYLFFNANKGVYAIGRTGDGFVFTNRLDTNGNILATKNVLINTGQNEKFHLSAAYLKQSLMCDGLAIHAQKNGISNRSYISILNENTLTESQPLTIDSIYNITPYDSAISHSVSVTDCIAGFPEIPFTYYKDYSFLTPNKQRHGGFGLWPTNNQFHYDRYWWETNGAQPETGISNVISQRVTDNNGTYSVTYVLLNYAMPDGQKKFVIKVNKAGFLSNDTTTSLFAKTNTDQYLQAYNVITLNDFIAKDRICVSYKRITDAVNSVNENRLLFIDRDDTIINGGIVPRLKLFKDVLLDNFSIYKPFTILKTNTKVYAINKFDMAGVHNAQIYCYDHNGVLLWTNGIQLDVSDAKADDSGLYLVGESNNNFYSITKLSSANGALGYNYSDSSNIGKTTAIELDSINDAIYICGVNHASNSVCKVVKYKINTILGVENASLSALYTVSPNPVNSIIVLNSKKTLQNANILIENITGNVVARFENINGFQANINVSNLKCGLYFISIQQGNQIERIKIIKN